jgi:hypothetical protein
VSDPFVVIMNNKISLNQPEHQRASTGKSNKSKSFGKQYIKAFDLFGVPFDAL